MLIQGLSALRVSGPLQKYQRGATMAPGAVVLLPERAGPDVQAATATAAVVLTNENAQARSRWEVQGARPVSLPGRIVAPPMQSGGPARPTRIVLDKNAHAAFTALADGTVVSLEAIGNEIKGQTWNAVGRLKASDAVMADQVILLTAHLDHLGGNGAGADPIFNGADDDASGGTAVLELVEALAKGKRPKRTGYERTNLGPELARHGARIVADPHPDQNCFERSDNIQLARKGVVAQTVSSYGLHKDYHQPSDDLAHLDIAHMTESIQSMLEPVRWLANGTFKLEWLAGKRP